MINRIIQTIVENKDFLEKSLEDSINANEISIFSRDGVKIDFGHESVEMI